MHCGSLRPVSAPAKVESKVEFSSTFRAATYPSANQIVVMQIHYMDATWTLSNGNRLCDTTRRGYVKKQVGDLRTEDKVIIAVGKHPIMFEQTLGILIFAIFVFIDVR